MSEDDPRAGWNEDIPGNWAWASLSDVLTDVTDSKRKLATTRYQTSGAYPVIDQGQEFTSGFTDDATLVSPAQIPCIVWGDHTRRAKFVQTRFVQGADGVKVLEPTSAVDATFVFKQLAFAELPNKGYSRHFKFLRMKEFPLPPLHEQQRIVRRLNNLSTRTTTVYTHLIAIEKLVERYKAAVLRLAFSGELTSDWRFSNPPPQSSEDFQIELLKIRRDEWIGRELLKHPEQSVEKVELRYSGPNLVLPRIFDNLPIGWISLSTEALSTKVSDGVHKKPSYVGEGVPFVMVKNMTAGPGISFEDTRFISAADHEEFTKRTDPERDDILITKDGTLGVVRRVMTDLNFSIFVSVALVKPASRAMSPYLEYAYQSPQVQEQMVGVGSGLQHIHLTDLRKDQVPIAPFSEQVEIVRRIEIAFDTIDRLAAEAAKALKLTNRLDQRILAKAFAGELVPQDPNDEPAEVLLERVRTERAAAPRAASRRGRGRKAAG